MKKTLALLIALLMAATMLTCVAAEDEPTVYTSGNYKYILLEDGTAEISDYTGKAKDLTIPAEIDGRRVTAIGDKAFYFCDSLTSITIPDSVTTIGDNAFRSCPYLTSIFIPDSVTTIGVNPFQSCISLTSIKVSSDHPSLATIDGVLFEKSTKTLICYPYAFSAETYSIPQGIHNIGESAFSSCDSLISVTIPDSVTAIGDSAFSGCDSLTSVTIPGSVTSIGNSTFNNCWSLASISIPDSVTAIGDKAFFNCTALTSVTIPDSVTAIGNYAFSDCHALTSVTIPNSVTAIGDKAFSNCRSLTSIHVERNSYAAQYCKDNGLPYAYPDVNDWLLN